MTLINLVRHQPVRRRPYPKIRIVLHASDRFVDVVQEGCDIALRTHFAPLPDSDLVQRRVSTEYFWLVASPAYLRGRKVDDPDDLYQRPADMTHWGFPE